MTSKESLKNICLECEIANGKVKIACPFRSISNEYCENYQTIEKDLEMLEIIKKYLYYSKKSHCIRMRDIRKRQSNFDYEELKEWLKNE